MNEISTPPKLRVDGDASLLFRVLGTARELETRLESALAEIGLSIAKAGVLKALANAGGSRSLGDVAECNKCVRSNITQLIDRLDEDGLVKRCNDPDDRRVRRASLTPKGIKAYRDAARIVAKHERVVFESLSEDEAAALGEALRLLARST